MSAASSRFIVLATACCCSGAEVLGAIASPAIRSTAPPPPAHTHSLPPPPSGGHDVETEVEERSISIVFNLLQNQGPKGGRRERVAAKFVEAEFEKCDRLMELYFRCGGGRRDGEAGNGEVRGGTVLQVAGEESEGSMLIAPPTFCPLDPPPSSVYPHLCMRAVDSRSSCPHLSPQCMRAADGLSSCPQVRVPGWRGILLTAPLLPPALSVCRYASQVAAQEAKLAAREEEEEEEEEEVRYGACALGGGQADGGMEGVRAAPMVVPRPAYSLPPPAWCLCAPPPQPAYSSSPPLPPLAGH